MSVGEIEPDWCNATTKVPGIGRVARAGIWWYCGGHTLLALIPGKAKGICAMVRLITPITMIGLREITPQPAIAQGRKKRDAFDLSIGSPTYIDSIGVPRGVPNEYKLVDQIATGFENIPIISALFPVTPNKNVDRINFVHYNVLRLTNLTRDAIEGLSEQLRATSLMAVQNRMALDMLLAEKGGVCFMFGDNCCTFIPNNTAPDGSVTRALDGLKALSKEMQEASGISNPMEEWFTKVFGKWKALIMSLFMSVAVFIAIVVICGCCCIPCIRSLTQRLITAAIEKGDAKNPPPYTMPLMVEDDDDISSEEDDSV
ncbi:syncytin-B-like [Brachyhypopomus gauderio]|uniref:syncytin-B-like n=1 Tax=Brachyhypopomus gauderio TaxID=698409 RepID=UPI004042AA16